MADSHRTTGFYRKRLPHWEVERGRYFTTLRLAGSIPAHAAAQIRRMAREAESAPETERVRLERRIFLEMERWLDRLDSVRHLQHPTVAEMVMEAIAVRERSVVWHVLEYVIMPNHVHLFFEGGETGLFDLLVSFKRWTGRRARAILDVGPGRFWHREWFDHWSRDEDEDQRIVEYIRNNPVKAGLVRNYLDWPYASWRTDESGAAPSR